MTNLLIFIGSSGNFPGITSGDAANTYINIIGTYQATATEDGEWAILTPPSCQASIDPVTGLLTFSNSTAIDTSVVISLTTPNGTATKQVTLTVVSTLDNPLVEISNIARVYSGPLNPTVFTLSTAAFVTFVDTYHYYSGGLTPGTISIQHSDGTIYGPWQCAGAIGQGGVENAYWYAFPYESIKAGTYTVVDSDPATWSYNALSNYMGFFIMRGTPE